MSIAWPLLQLLACALAIGVAGTVLCRSADRLAVLHGWGHGWVGLALLATVTSLPELASGITAVTVVHAPNLAVGGALGACIFNLGFLAIVEIAYRRGSMYGEAGPGHVLTAVFGVVMLGGAALSMVAAHAIPSLLHIGLASPALLVVYVIALRAAKAAEEPAVAAPDGLAARREWRRFGLSAATVVAAGIWLPFAAAALGDAVGLSRSAAGTLLMALVTTLPEMAVTLAALRMGALDMAIGNLLGSNLFNMVVLAMDDLFWLEGPLMADVAPAHVATALMGMLMTGLVALGLLLRPRRRLAGLCSGIGLALAAAYGVNALLVLRAG